MSARGRRVLAGLLLVGLGGCTADDSGRDRAAPAVDASTPRATADTLTDAEGRSVVVPLPIRRMVSLVPSATRTVQALGGADLLVGRTDFDTTAALAHLPSVGGGLQPSAEMLLALEPDLVVRFAGESDRATPERLDRAGVAHLAVRPERIEDVHVMIETLGRVTGREGAADSITRAHRAVIDSIRTRVAGAPAVRAAFTLGGDPPYVAGSRTYVGELIELAGGMNAFADLERPWAGVSPETMVSRRPEVLLVLEGTRLDPRLTRRAEVRTVPSFVQLPGPELDRAALAVAAALHPDLFDTP